MTAKEIARLIANHADLTYIDIVFNGDSCDEVEITDRAWLERQIEGAIQAERAKADTFVEALTTVEATVKSWESDGADLRAELLRIIGEALSDTN